MEITKNMTIGEIVEKNQKAIEVLQNFGMGCVGWPSAQAETLEEACMVHGLDVNELMKKLYSV